MASRSLPKPRSAWRGHVVKFTQTSIDLVGAGRQVLPDLPRTQVACGSGGPAHSHFALCMSRVLAVFGLETPGYPENVPIKSNLGCYPGIPGKSGTIMEYVRTASNLQGPGRNSHGVSTRPGAKSGKACLNQWHTLDACHTTCHAAVTWSLRQRPFFANLQIGHAVSEYV